VGYDAREDVAWKVCRHSILRHASQAIEVRPLKQQAVRELGLYDRPVDSSASTEFSLTRFLTPYLAHYEDWSLFVDCDFLFTADLCALFDALDPSKAVYVVQHDYVPANAVKMDGKGQTVYPRKNWSSFLIFNGRHPAVKALTPDVVNQATPAYLHRFGWIENDEDIGALDLRWNFLVGEYEKPETTPSAIHYTNGGPWFPQWTDVDYGDLWQAAFDDVLAEEAAERAA
jgi:lipopolysaccharide biosynthesis glycosyltransferase